MKRVVRRGGAGRRSRSTRSQRGSSARRGAIHDEDVASCRAMGAHRRRRRARRRAHPHALQRRRAGDGRLRHGARRHPRARSSRASRSRCFADETRPFLQGARLTAWELVRDGIDTTVITDSMAGAADARRRRSTSSSSAPIASRPTATRPTRSAPTRVAVLAHEHGIPFYVAAPLSTIDLATPDGDAAFRSRSATAREVTHLGVVAADARGRAASATRRSTSRRTATSPASSPSAASSRAPYTESLTAALSTTPCSAERR